MRDKFPLRIIGDQHKSRFKATTSIDKLKEQLNKEKGYQVEIQNASSGKEMVTARLQIIGAGS